MSDTESVCPCRSISNACNLCSPRSTPCKVKRLPGESGAAGLPSSRIRIDVASRGSIDLNFFTVRLQLASEKVGAIFHGGLEGEYMVMPKLSLTGRVEGRYAQSSKLFKGSTVDLYGDPTAALKDRKINFSGYGAYIGLRGYIGY